MTTPPPPANGPGDSDDAPRVDLGKHAPGDANDTAQDTGQGAEPDATPADAPFDPYRFGRPEHPVPPEYAPPGYVPDPPAGPASPYGTPRGYGAPGGYGNAPYPQQGMPGGYQLPPPYQSNQSFGPYPGAAGPSATNGKAVAAMVLGIASIPFFFLTFLDLALIIPALVLGILGLSQAKRLGGKGHSQAVAGLACMVVGTIVATVFTVWLFSRIGTCAHYLRDGDNGSYQQCVDDRFN